MTLESLATPITTNSTVIEVTPTLDTNIYADGDRLGSVMTITGAARANGMEVMLADVAVIDKAKQAVAIDILFFDESPTVASDDNAAIDISDAEMADKFLGRVSVAAADYTALANCSEASPAAFNKLLKPIASSKDLYAVMVVRNGTPTYGASDLVVKFKFLQD